MAKDRLVLESIESDDGRRCVDIFRRTDDSFGFEEYVREPEDNSGWRAVSQTSDMTFATEAEARGKAAAYVPWLRT